MPTHDVRATADVHTTEGAPNSNHADRRWLGVRAGSGTIQRSFLHIPHGLEPGLQVASGTFRVWLRTGWSGGPHDFTVRRITSGWRETGVTYNNEPDTSATNAVTVNITDGQSGDVVEFDITAMLADVVAGQAWHGLRLGTTSAGVVRKIFSSEAGDPAVRPQLEVEFFSKPRPPVDLTPSGGLRTNRSQPVLTWRFRDKDGDEQAEFQVQLADNSAMTTNVFDTGWLPISDEQCDLATTAFPAMVDAQTRFWRVRTRDVNGNESGWSDVESFTRVVKSTFTIDSPLDAGTVDETTPTITTTLASRDQEAISYRLEEWDPTDLEWVEVWEKRRHAAPESAGVAHSFAVAAERIRRTGRDYRMRVRSWDVVDRVWDGDPVYYQDFATFTFVRSAVPSPVTSLLVEQDGPGVRLTFNRAAGLSTPDWFALRVDDERVFGRIDPSNIVDGGDPIVYSFVWYGAQPRESLEYEVEAVTLDGGRFKHSQSNDTQTFQSEPAGIWFLDDDDPPYHPSTPPRRMRLVANHESTPQLTIGESGATYNPVGRRDPVTVIDAVRGLEGTVTGLIRGDDPEGSGFIRTAKWMKRPYNVGRRFRMIVGGESIPVELGAMSLAPKSNPGGAKLYEASVDVVQVDEFRDSF